MSVAGLGFRAGSRVDSLRAALHAAQQAHSAPLTALATAADKADHPALLQLAAELRLPIIPIHLPLLANQAATPSAHVPARYGAHSVAEAAALAAAGPAGVLRVGRCVSPDGMATAALASSQLNYLAPTPSQNERLPETPQDWLCQAAGVAPCKGVGGKRLRWSLGVRLIHP